MHERANGSGRLLRRRGLIGKRKVNHGTGFVTRIGDTDTYFIMSEIGDLVMARMTRAKFESLGRFQCARTDRPRLLAATSSGAILPMQIEHCSREMTKKLLPWIWQNPQSEQQNRLLLAFSKNLSSETEN